MMLVRTLRNLAAGLQPKTAPIPLLVNGVGQIGHLSHRQGVYVNPTVRRHFAAMLRDHYRVERTCRGASRGLLGADDVLPVAALGTDSRDAMRAAKSVLAAMASWNDVIAARTGGKYWDFLGAKESQTTVANAWSSFLRTAGVPSAAAHDANIPGGKRLTSASAGAIALPMTLGGSEHLYLTNAGAMHATGTNVALLVDVLVSAANISATSTVSQDISSTALSRWTTGEGLAMTLEVTTALGATAANITISYTNQAGTAGGSTGAIAMTTSAVAARLQPVLDGPMIRLAANDYGVRAIEGCIFSASMAAGALAAMIHKPIVVIPTVSTSTFLERSTPAMLGGIRTLTASAGGEKPFLGWFVAPSTTSTGAQNFLIETVFGAP